MSRLRPLLRLDDKVAAEGRRLQHIGGARMRFVGPAMLLLAALAHGAVLLLPAMRAGATPEAASLVPDLPLVWRPISPPAIPPGIPAKQATPPLAPPASEGPGAQDAAAVAAATLAIEPVPEPVPELRLTMTSSAMEALVPDPDTLPPEPEMGPPSRVVPTPGPEPPPVLIEKVLPVYPAAARALRVEGLVSLRLSILPDGSVGGATVVACSRAGLGFEGAAVNAVRRWRYQPARDPSSSRSLVVTVRFEQPEVRP